MDMMWVEPQWMETYYDWTVNKKWDYKKFPGQPYWYSNETENGEHGGSFISRMHALGYKICLWLNIDTDLSVQSVSVTETVTVRCFMLCYLLLNGIHDPYA